MRMGTAIGIIPFEGTTHGKGIFPLEGAYISHIDIHLPDKVRIQDIENCLIYEEDNTFFQQSSFELNLYYQFIPKRYKYILPIHFGLGRTWRCRTIGKWDYSVVVPVKKEITIELSFRNTTQGSAKCRFYIWRE